MSYYRHWLEFPVASVGVTTERRRWTGIRVEAAADLDEMVAAAVRDLPILDAVARVSVLAKGDDTPEVRPLIQQARADGYSWQNIADALGVESVDALRQRHRPGSSKATGTP